METKDEPSGVNEPCSDIGSSEKKRFEENAAKDTHVLSSSSSSVLEAGTNQYSIKETAGEDTKASDDADAEKTRSLRVAYTDILADIEANPKILESEGKKMITFLGSQDITPLAFNTAALRQIESNSKSIETKNQEPESLKERKQEAIKLGVGLSDLVAEAMFLATDELLDKTDEELRKLMIDANGPLDVNGIVVYNLTAIFDGLKKSVKEKSNRPRIDLTQSSQTSKFFRLFSEAIARLEEVIRGIRNLSCTRVLEEEPEELSAIDREIEDCKGELRKIELAITEVKQLHFNSKHALSSDEPKRCTIRTASLEKAFFRLWNSLFQSGRKRKASSFDSSDSEDSVCQPSIQ